MRRDHQRFAGSLTLLAALAFAPHQASAAAPQIQSVLKILHGPAPQDRFHRPLAIGVDRARGMVVIADTGNNRLAVFDASGRARGVFSPAAQENAKGIPEPCAVALDGKSRLFVLDEMRREIEVSTPTGSHIAFLRPSIPESPNAAIQDLAIGASGRIYLLCAGERSGIAVLEPNGAHRASIGFQDEGDLAFGGPMALAVDEGETKIAVIDPQADRAIRIVSVDGAMLASFGTHGAGDGTLSLAADVAWGPDGTLWVADAIRHSISIFDEEGRWLGRIGGFGNGPGQFKYPTAIAFLAPDTLLVLERGNARCQFLDVGNSGASVLALDEPAPAFEGPSNLLRKGGDEE